MNEYIGIDIGGTKTAIVRGDENGTILEKKRFATTTKEETLEMIFQSVADLKTDQTKAIGVSCGGPLNSRTGVILGPPNLPGWDEVPITDMLTERFGLPAYLRNDADACAVAEWQFGAGKGAENMIFLTFGTGLGAGLILNGKLYSGTNGNAGETGHIRLEGFGPVGYGKAGSFEGFCSGGGLAQIGYIKALEKAQTGVYPLYFKKGMTAADVTAKTVADAAYKGDETAKEVYRICGEQLGKGLSVLIDILNPERIVIGSIFARSEDLLRDGMERVINKEALPQSLKCCKIVPAALGERIGDYAAVSAALL